MTQDDGVAIDQFEILVDDASTEPAFVQNLVRGGSCLILAPGEGGGQVWVTNQLQVLVDIASTEPAFVQNLVRWGPFMEVG